MTGLDVEKRQAKEKRGEQQHHCILHARTPLLSQPERQGLLAAIGPTQPLIRQSAEMFRKKFTCKPFERLKQI
jgi:hypothetical protein